MAGKFEVYMDAKGKYRFRLKAGNGQIIAVGEAYESMAACTGGIDSIRANAPGAALVDLTGSGAHAKPAMKEPGAKHSDMKHSEMKHSDMKHSEMKHGEAKRPDMQSSDMRGDGMKQPAPKPGEARQPAAAGTRPGMPASSGPASSKPSMH
ncbi:MAG TPA: YegP family protein [Actinocrinis sp.]|jgi:hypothetical protein